MQIEDPDEKDSVNKMIFTIGHSTHSIDEFISILKSFSIEVIIDVRSLPGSKKFPQFNKEELSKSLSENNIDYVHIPLLGGRRKVIKNSKNTEWKNDSFRGFADYMETGDFKTGIEKLLSIPSDKRICIMCAESLYWKCHRSMISDFIKSINIDVHHIMAVNKSVTHKYTMPAKIVNGKLTYHEL